jgi:NAD(P)-dependent dehydrogenase (short-subunit alcohol dehydrogenase family)
MILDGKRAIVTGGSRGTGRAIAEELVRQGARVAITHTREAADLPSSLRAFRCSVTDAKTTAAMVKELEREWGGVDILVNNAGISQNLPLALLEEEDFDAVMDVNVKGTFLTSKAVLRGMIRCKAGTILNIGSLAGTRTIDAPIHYCASKAAIVGLTQAMAKEVARYGIRINCLAPGLLEDGLGKNLPEHRLKDYLEHTALQRVGRFDEVARFAAFLVSDGNSYMNGETVVMNGGL